MNVSFLGNGNYMWLTVENFGHAVQLRHLATDPEGRGFDSR